MGTLVTSLGARAHIFRRGHYSAKINGLGSRGRYVSLTIII